MKVGAIIRICIWSLVSLILVGVLVTGLVLGNLDWSHLSVGFGGYRFSDAQTYSVGNTTLEAGAVHSIDVEWFAGSIRIGVADDEKITVRENAVISPNQALRWRIHNGELQIRYCKPRWLGSIGFSKDLEILIPASMMISNEKLQRIAVENVSSSIHIAEIAAVELDIESVSGNITMADIATDRLEIENVSGVVNVTESKIEALEAATVSGNFTIGGTVEYVDLSGVSAMLDLTDDICPRKVSVESVSGLIRLTIPADSGFRLSLDTISGSLYAPDFQMTTSGGDNYLCGDGSADFELESVSGRIDIQAIFPQG